MALYNKILPDEANAACKKTSASTFLFIVNCGLLALPTLQASSFTPFVFLPIFSSIVLTWYMYLASPLHPLNTSVQPSYLSRYHLRGYLSCGSSIYSMGSSGIANYLFATKMEVLERE